MRSVVVIAEKEELKLVEQLGLSNEPIIVTGVGAVNVISTLKNLPKDIHIINVGYAGSNNIDIGKLVVVSSVNTHHTIANFNEPTYICCSAGGLGIKFDEIAPCYTSTDFVTHTDIKDNCVFDMELAYICALFDKVTSYKIVSDKLNFNEYVKNSK